MKRNREDDAGPDVSKVQQLLRQALDAQPEHGACGTAAAGAAPQPRPQAAGPASGSDDDEQLLAAVPSEVMTAVLRLRSQMLARGLALPAVLLRTQISSLVRDATEMDRELDRLRRANTIRMFKLSTGPDEYAVLLTRDYEQILCESAEKAHPEVPSSTGASPGPPSTSGRGATHTGAQLCNVAKVFCQYVLPQHTDVHISHRQLMRLLSGAVCSKAVNTRPGLAPHTAGAGSCGPNVAASSSDMPAMPSLDEQVSCLMQLGAVSRHTSDFDMYMLSVPGLGPVVKAVLAGRREVHSLLARKKYKEAPEQQLLDKTKLRHTPMGMAFHLSDMLGLGLVQRVDTTVGPIIRLLKSQQA